jgi:hypothetical protein
VLDEEGAAIAHLLPADSAGNCVLASAIAAGCSLVEAKTASRYSKTENFSSTEKAKKGCVRF